VVLVGDKNKASLLAYVEKNWPNLCDEKTNCAYDTIPNFMRARKLTN